MDDNATCHQTLSVQDCLDSEGIQRLVWPARSPDLNHIENVSDALGRQVAGRNYPPSNKNNLIRALTEEWDKLPQQLLDNVVQSMDTNLIFIQEITERIKLTEHKDDNGDISSDISNIPVRRKRNWKVGGSNTTGRPYLKEARAPCIAVEMEAFASEAASGTSSAREAARRLGLAPSSVRNILRRILQLYPYKLQSCHELLPADTAQREAFSKWAFSKMEQDPTWVFNILWTDEAHFSLHGPFFFETQCPVNGWIMETVNSQCYLTLLRETVVPCLIQRGQISNVTFMQDGATSQTANPVKPFLIQTFGKDRIVSRRCRYPWTPRSLDLTLADFWLWGYLKSRVYLSGPSSLSELKDAIRGEVSSIYPSMLNSSIAGFVTRLECLLPCCGGHMEHILV
ncbi:uncharacterized protein TNCV_4778161 [Trichonephila clavipes]|nr:uncharacterized protein TNCV_4778161 [Trichonephila clavipes]